MPPLFPLCNAHVPAPRKVSLGRRTPSTRIYKFGSLCCVPMHVRRAACGVRHAACTAAMAPSISLLPPPPPRSLPLRPGRGAGTTPTSSTATGRHGASDIKAT
jgi:hypothetical protein